MNRLFYQNSSVVLREVLNNEDNLDIVQNFIEAILKIKIKKIILRPYLGSKVKYLPNQQKYGIITVRVIKEDGEELNVGIQIIDGFYTQEKILTFGASIHVNQIEYEDYSDLAKTVTINILDFEFFSTPAYHKIIKFFERENDGIKIKDATEFHILELAKFKENECRNEEEEWFTFFKGIENNSFNETLKNNTKIKKLEDILIDYWKKEEL